MQTFEIISAFFTSTEVVIGDEFQHVCLGSGCYLAESQNWPACGIAVGTAVFKHYGSWSDVDTKQAFGTTCNTQFKGGFHRWQWKWSGKFWCPSLSPTITGDSTQWKSRTGAIEHAIQDYVTKMTASGLLKPEQLRV
ncbi:hypothetical protein I4U23_004891 [Adineta vaga]|nr:hypothetical protein I4U23_004891 [Adineta vaga]